MADLSEGIFEEGFEEGFEKGVENLSSAVKMQKTSDEPFIQAIYRRFYD